MKIITLNQLLNNWWRFTETITHSDIETLEWDELMLLLNICCPDAEGQSIEISDIDMTTYRTPAVSFSLIE